jgi:hypothetical protein
MLKDQYTNSDDILKVQGVRENGYGIVPKLVMQDRRLTPEAKAIYAYFCSFAGAGATAFPGRSKILYDLNMGEKRYYNHFGLLKKYGYILVEQQKNENTKRFTRNIYTLCEHVPYGQNDGTDIEPYGRFACTAEAYTANDGTNINSIKINSSKISQSSQSSHVMSKLTAEKEKPTDTTLTSDQEVSAQTILLETKKDAPINKLVKPHQFKEAKINTSDYNTYRGVIEENIDYHDLTHDSHDKALVENLVEVMLDVICTEAPDTIKMGDEIKSRKIVRDTYLKLRYDHIQHVISQYKSQHHQIINKQAYLRKMLYTVYQEMDAHYTNQVRADGVVW